MKVKYLALFSMILAFVLIAPHASAQDTATTAAAPGTTATKSTTKKSKSTGVAKTAGRADSELADLSTKLTLTDDQKAKIKPIIDDKEAKIHVIKKSTTGSADDSKSKTEAIRTSANTQIRALLTPDQQKIFDSTEKKGGKKSAS